MTAEQFAYWLQGYAELHDEAPTAEQWQSIRDHLATVFVKVTPNLHGPLYVGSPNTMPRHPFGYGTAVRTEC